MFICNFSYFIYDHNNSCILRLRSMYLNVFVVDIKMFKNRSSGPSERSKITPFNSSCFVACSCFILEQQTQYRSDELV